MAWARPHTVLAILCCAEFLCYVDRMVMASTIPFIALDFHLSSARMGAVLSAFFVGYALMQIPGGMLTDRYGPRIVLLASIGWWSVMTALTGAVSGLVAMLVVRVLFGLGEGPFPAAASKAVSAWFPPQKVSSSYGLILGASCVGAMVAPLFVSATMASLGWRAAFYLLFVPGVALVLPLWGYVRNGPTAQEQDASQRHQIDEIARNTVKDSFLECLRTPAVAWCAISLFLANVVGWGLMNWLPTYLLRAQGFDVQRMGVFTAVTNLAGAVGSVVGGYACDGYFTGRLRIPIIFGLLTSAVFTYLAAIAPNGEWAVTALALVYFLANVTSTALFTLPMLVVPKHVVATAFGVVNTAGQLAGVLAPLLVGYILEFTHENFRIVMYVMVLLALVAVYPAIRIQQAGQPMKPCESAV
jgi:MFS family permease